jgi:hypothetical protein
MPKAHQIPQFTGVANNTVLLVFNNQPTILETFQVILKQSFIFWESCSPPQ